MAASDAFVKKQVRAAFAKHRVESRTLNFQYSKGRLFVRGKLIPLGQKDMANDAFLKLLKVLEDELMMLQNVNSVTFDIFGWEKVGTTWKAKE
jgi:hypothetical protein